MDWDKKFKAEYSYARGWLLKQDNFAKDWQPLVKRLHTLMGELGFNAGEAAALTELRDRADKGKDGKKIAEDRSLLEAVGGWSDDATAALDDKVKMRVAALKLLRHVYMLSKSGNRVVWVVSLPKDFRDWPSDDVNARANTRSNARALLLSSAEVFSDEHKKHLGAATFHALAWCQKAVSLLAVAGTAADGKGKDADKASLDVVRRWFAEPGLEANNLKTSISTLQLGFKKIIAMLGRGRFILTDWVPLRSASTADEIAFLNSEAFTFPTMPKVWTWSM